MIARRNEEGFTLLEALIAITILAVGLLAVATMQTTAVRGNSRAIGLTEAITVAQTAVERMESLDYSNAVFTDGGGANDGVAGLGDVPADAQDLGVKIGNRGLTYNVYWNVAPDWPLANTSTVRVIVVWTERGSQRRASLDFIKSDII
jgi:prepilin-type N-terminal cleavage/methylation domain-containing protein